MCSLRCLALIAFLLISACTPIRRANVSLEATEGSSLEVAQRLDAFTRQHLESIGFKEGFDIIQSARDLLKYAQERYAAAKRYAVATIVEAKQKWGRVRSALNNATSASFTLAGALTKFVTLMAGISYSITKNSLQFVFDGGISYKDLRIFAYVRTCWNITKDILSTAWSMRSIVSVAQGLGQVLVSIRDLAGFAVRAVTGKIETGSFLDTNSTFRHTLSTKKFDVDIFKPVAWFENAWRHAMESTLEGVVKNVNRGVYAFESAALSLEKIRDFLEPLTRETFDAWGYWDKTKYLWNHGEDMVTNFKDLGTQWGGLQELVNDTAKPLIEDVEKASLSFKGDADVYVPGRIDRSKCDWKYIHLVGDNAEVDFSSMTCYTFYMRVCRCRKQHECYVRRSLRPAPQEKVRCFQPVDEDDQDFFDPDNS